MSAFDGSPLWSYDTGAPQISALEVSKNLVFVATYPDESTTGARTIYALRANDGSLRWHTTLKGFFPARMVFGESALYVLLDQSLYALDWSTGARLWRVQMPNSVNVAVQDGGAVYVGGSMDVGVGWMAALRVADGGVLWSNARLGEFNNSFPVVANGILYVGGDDKAVYAISTNDGRVVWKARTGDRVDASPAVSNGVVYVASQDYFLYALSAASGKQLWYYQIGSSLVSSPIVGP